MHHAVDPHVLADDREQTHRLIRTRLGCQDTFRRPSPCGGLTVARLQRARASGSSGPRFSSLVLSKAWRVPALMFPLSRGLYLAGTMTTCPVSSRHQRWQCARRFIGLPARLPPGDRCRTEMPRPAQPKGHNMPHQPPASVCRPTALPHHLQTYSFELVSKASDPLGMLVQLAPAVTAPEFQTRFRRQTLPMQTMLALLESKAVAPAKEQACPSVAVGMLTVTAVESPRSVESPQNAAPETDKALAKTAERMIFFTVNFLAELQRHRVPPLLIVGHLSAV